MAFTRLIVGVAWVIGSVVLLSVPCNLFKLGIDHLEQHGTRVPHEFLMIYSVAAFGGLAIVPSVVAVMALRGKLPGTRVPNPTDQTEETEPPTLNP